MNMGFPLTFLLDYEQTLEATRAIGNALIRARGRAPRIRGPSLVKIDGSVGPMLVFEKGMSSRQQINFSP
jgi:hypothetical protein